MQLSHTVFQTLTSQGKCSSQMLKLTQVPKLLRDEKRKANDSQSWQKPGTQRAINIVGRPTNNSQSSCSAVPWKTRRALAVTQSCCDEELTWRTINCWRHGLRCPIALCCWLQLLLHSLPRMTLSPTAANYLCWVHHKSIRNLKAKQNKDEPMKNRLYLAPISIVQLQPKQISLVFSFIIPKISYPF